MAAEAAMVAKKRRGVHVVEAASGRMLAMKRSAEPSSQHAAAARRRSGAADWPRAPYDASSPAVKLGQRRVPGHVVLLVPEERVQHVHPLEVEPHVVFVGHPDAPVELDGLLRDVAPAHRELHLGRRDGALRSVGSALVARMAARIAVDLHSSVSTNMSTARCWSAWKLPILTPNCSRVRRYSVVMWSTVRAIAAPSAQAPAAPRSIASSSASRASAAAFPGAGRRRPRRRRTRASRRGGRPWSSPRGR